MRCIGIPSLSWQLLGLLDGEPEEDQFVSASEASSRLFLTPGRKSTYLPQDSIFDTLTESVLAGETRDEVVAEDGPKREIRRGMSPI